MGQWSIAQGANEWYLIASRGDIAVRVRSGMLLGETESGVLSFEPSFAQVELHIADDNDLVLSAVGDNELESAGASSGRVKRLARHRRMEIRLPHNVLQLGFEFVDSAPADAIVTVRALGSSEVGAAVQADRLAERVPDALPTASLAARPPRSSNWRPAGGRGGVKADVAPVSTAPAAAQLSLAPSLVESEPRPIRARTAHRRIEPAVPPRQRSLAPRLAALAVLVGVGLAWLYQPLRETPVSTLVESVSLPTQTIAPVDLPQVEYRPMARVAEPERAPPAVPEPVVAPVIEPLVLPSVERRATPQVARTVEPADPLADSPPTVRAPDPALIAELEQIGSTAQALAAELARRRDLLAAELALAQGHLTAPPESSAYTLFSRVLAQDPESDRAKSGLQAVRQTLINRALAQLAIGGLDDARRSLRAAEDAGANPQLVADLRGEVDYRQRLMDAR
jgi:hypothetical protein